MEDQLTVRLPREMGNALRKRAIEMQRKPSELIRMAVGEFLQTAPAPRKSAGSRAMNLIGSLDTGIPDLALRHREHILKKLRRGR